jgi:methyltransferase-like protein|tara:strand:- start:5451 stop:5678 length:228 start_codon:yes stop_codon:yes gene_type:complete
MSDSKKKPSSYEIDADDTVDEEFEIVDVNGEKGILTLEFDDLVKEQNKDLSEEELQEIADKLIVSMFGAPKNEQN